MSPAHKCTSWHKFILNVQMYQKEPWKWKVSLRNQVTREWAINRIWTMCQKNWKIWHFILHIENARHLENCKIEAVIWSQESFLLQYNNMTIYIYIDASENKGVNERPHFLDNPREGGNYTREYHTGIYRNEKTYP